MKKLTLFLLVLISISIIHAQAPKSFKYQAVARDQSGNILADRTIGIKVNILQGSQDGPVVFSETHQIQTNSFGLINMGIGKGEIRAGNFSTINWGGNSHYVRVEMDPAGGTNYEFMGTSELLSVPYALYAESSGDNNRQGDTDWGINGNHVYTGVASDPSCKSGNVGIGVSTPNAKLAVVMQYGFNSIFRRVNNDWASNSLFLMQRARGTIGSESPVQNGDRIGQIRFEGYHGAGGGQYGYPGIIICQVDAPISGTTVPGNLQFWTTNTSGSTAERMRINNFGNVGIGVITPSRQLEIAQSFQLPNTTHADTGVIYKGGDRFIHNYQSSGKHGFNTFVGINAGNFTMDGPNSFSASYNTATGSYSLHNNTTGYNNTANGYQALYSNTTGYENTANGSYALYSNTTGYNNTANGLWALRKNTTGKNNTANGYGALNSNTTAGGNTANGSYALYSNTTVGWNTANGSYALFSNTTGFNNTANGSDALYSNTTGYNNTANGSDALYSNTTAGENTANGYKALYSNTTGNSNTANGSDALFSNTTGYNNTANGSSALYSNTTGFYNTANGSYALYSNSTGNENTVNGYRALRSNTDGGENTAVGDSAGYTNTTGNQNTFVGSSADASSNNYDNCMALGNEAEVTASNKVRIGNDDITEIGGCVGWTTISDARYKKNIQNSTLGLSFIKRLHPVAYNLTFEGQKGILYNGFIAQEVETVLQEINEEFSGLCVPDNETGRYGLRYAEFVVPLVKAVQEQQEQIENQQQQIDELKAMVEELM